MCGGITNPRIDRDGRQAAGICELGISPVETPTSRHISAARLNRLNLATQLIGSSNHPHQPSCGYETKKLEATGWQANKAWINGLNSPCAVSTLNTLF
jgi:hypothetical protein